MADQTKTGPEIAAEAPLAVADRAATETGAVAGSAETAAKPAPAVKAAKAAPKAKATAKAKTAKTAKASRPKAAKARRKPSAQTPRAAKTTSARNERTAPMNFDPSTIFAGFTAANPFQTLFADASERSQDAMKRSQKVAEQFVEMTRANVEAVVEAGRIAAEGGRSIVQDAVAKSRENVEQAADVVRSLAEAKSPTEFLQLQSDFARSSFDRLVAESSRMTESVVKLAGDAIQPISNRATANAERINELVA